MNIATLLDTVAQTLTSRIMIGARTEGISAERWHALSRGGAEIIRTRKAAALMYIATYGPAFPIAMFAAARAGVPLIPINYRLGEVQVEELLRNHPGSLAIADASWAEILARFGVPSVSPHEWLETSAQRATIDYSLVAESDTPGVCIYTSGTTSSPKCVQLFHHHLSSYVLEGVEFASCSADEAALISVPPYHIAGVANVLTNLFAGRRTVALPAFSPESWLDTVRTEEVTHALLVPTMLARIMESSAKELDVPSLRTLAYGGARMPKPLILKALEVWPHVDFCNAYGLTETSSTIALLGPQEHREAIGSTDPLIRDRLTSVGRVIPGITVEIRADDGSAVATGESGRIWVRGAQVSGHYAGGSASLDRAGFFDTRDEGHLDAHGYLYVEGRVDDTIIRGAENIAAAEVEDALLSHPSIADAVAIGIPDEEWGEHIEAVVVPRDDHPLDVEEVRSHVRRLLRGSKTPDRIISWSAIPRTETGKLIRREIRSMVLDGRRPGL